ncbi:MAG: hypothetical protein EOP41_04340 [Sphingobacteriaceae bacterium]|nr:MAG: hypothetical protein EOP41_04340 [Sphingobacteriaceae bacterium]
MMKDELIDRLNAKIERDQKRSASVFNLQGINKLFTYFKYPELPDFAEFNSIKSFLRSFS